MVLGFDDAAGPGAVEPLAGGGVLPEERIPKRGGEREDRPMMIGVAGFGIAGQRPIGEGTVFRIVEHQFIRPPRRQAGKDSQAAGNGLASERGGVFGAGQQEPGYLHRAEGGAGVEFARGVPGLITTAALIRRSVNRRPTRGQDWPDTACVVWAPKECPDIPTRSRSRRAASGWLSAAFQMASWSSTAATSATRSRKFSPDAAARIAAIRLAGGRSYQTDSSLPGCWSTTVT